MKPAKKPFPRAPVLITGVILLMGLALLLWPGLLLGVLPFLIGIVLLVAGLCTVVAALTLRPYQPEPGFTLMFGIIAAVVGLVFLLKQDISMMFLSVLFGLYVLFTAALSFVYAYSAFRAKESWLVSLLEGLVQVVLGFLLLFAPFTGLALWVQVLGIHFIVLAAGILVELYRLWKSA